MYLCNRTRNDHCVYLKQAAKSNFAAVAFYHAQKVLCRYTLVTKSVNILEIVLAGPQTASATIFVCVHYYYHAFK
jgi:hypothetical protein